MLRKQTVGYWFRVLMLALTFTFSFGIWIYIKSFPPIYWSSKLAPIGLFISALAVVWRRRGRLGMEPRFAYFIYIWIVVLWIVGFVAIWRVHLVYGAGWFQSAASQWKIISGVGGILGLFTVGGIAKNKEEVTSALEVLCIVHLFLYGMIWFLDYPTVQNLHFVYSDQLWSYSPTMGFRLRLFVQFLCIPLLWVTSALIASYKRRNIGLAIGVIVFVIIGSDKRSLLLALFITIILQILFYKIKNFRLGWVVTCGVVAGCAWPIIIRFSQIGVASALSRMRTLTYGVHIWSNNAWSIAFGVGRPRTLVLDPITGSNIHALWSDIGIIGWLFEYGLVGTLLLMALAIAGYRICVRPRDLKGNDLNRGIAWTYVLTMLMLPLDPLLTFYSSFVIGLVGLPRLLLRNRLFGDVIAESVDI